MNKTLKILGVTIIIVGLAFSLAMLLYKFPTSIQVPYQVQIPYQDMQTQAQMLDHKETYQIQSGHYAYSHFDLESGKTLVVTWQVDNTVSVYITTPSQFSSASLLGFPTSSLARKVATSSGSLSYQVNSAGTYYVIIHPYINDVNVASYKSELQWQEQVTKYRTETNYQTETTYRTSFEGLYLGLGVLAFGVATTAVGFANMPPLFKKKEIVFVESEALEGFVCDYCGTIYKKIEDGCPTCGARKRANNH